LVTLIVTNLAGKVVFEIKMMMIIIIIIINCAGLRVSVGPDWYLHFMFGRPGFRHRILVSCFGILFVFFLCVGCSHAFGTRQLH
jgi:cytochrome c oxidase subunit IV